MRAALVGRGVAVAVGCGVGDAVGLAGIITLAELDVVSIGVATDSAGV
jgi:hypothetical protein